ncbi:MAG: hypothetical protein FJ012_01610 [Chloroflexi bacterium]|nr:hypothetical protein [Chloroflexota bacterium]
MPIPFRDADEVEELGAAGYLKIDASDDGSTFRGGLFLVNARGEPLEFTYNRVDAPHTFLWRQADVRRHAIHKLVTSLLGTCPRVPKFIICLADEIDHDLFCNEIRLSIPICRVASVMKATSFSKLEVKTTVEDPQPHHLFWFPDKPAGDSNEHRLLHRLLTRGLLLEPFDRAVVGLKEIYSDHTTVKH